jgi:hypothetical protein
LEIFDFRNFQAAGSKRNPAQARATMISAIAKILQPAKTMISPMSGRPSSGRCNPGIRQITTSICSSHINQNEAAIAAINPKK